MRYLAGNAAEHGCGDARGLAANVPVIAASPRNAAPAAAAAAVSRHPSRPVPDSSRARDIHLGLARHALIELFRCPLLLKREEVSGENVSADQQRRRAGGLGRPSKATKYLPEVRYW